MSDRLTRLTSSSLYSGETHLNEHLPQCWEKSGLNLHTDATWVSDLAEERCSSLAHVENRHGEKSFLTEPYVNTNHYN